MGAANDSSEKSELPIRTWRRFNEAAAEEKRWMGNRLTWMFTPQVILIGAYVLILRFSNSIGDELSQQSASHLDDLSPLLFVILLVGLVMSLLGLAGLIAAGRMHWKWTTRLNRLAREINGDLEPDGYVEKAIVSFGSHPHWPARSSSIIPSLLALAFVVAWGCLLANWLCR